MMTLMEVPPGRCARLVSVGDQLRARLKRYGLHTGDRVCVLRRASLGGPLLVEFNRREIALGRAVAQKIRVELE